MATKGTKANQTRRRCGCTGTQMCVRLATLASQNTHVESTHQTHRMRSRFVRRPTELHRQERFALMLATRMRLGYFKFLLKFRWKRKVNYGRHIKRVKRIHSKVDNLNQTAPVTFCLSVCLVFPVDFYPLFVGSLRADFINWMRRWKESRLSSRSRGQVCSARPASQPVYVWRLMETNVMSCNSLASKRGGLVDQTSRTQVSSKEANSHKRKFLQTFAS